MPALLRPWAALSQLCIVAGLSEHAVVQHRRAVTGRSSAGSRASQQPFVSSEPLKDSHPWYHTTEEIWAEVERLSSTCKAKASWRSVEDGGVKLQVVHIRSRRAEPINRVFLLFGEHSRELISPETGLHLLRLLCGDTSEEQAEAVEAALQDSEFQMVLNANPRSRSKVELGHYCVRENPNDVDLNRNWGEKWLPDPVDVIEADPGSRPFSEPETRIVKQVVTDFRPTTFLSIHSGQYALLMPWAYERNFMAVRNRHGMLDIIASINAKHCRCATGAAGTEIGYRSPGTSMDYVFARLGASYAFIFEIYGDGESLPWQDGVPLPNSAFRQRSGVRRQRRSSSLAQKQRLRQRHRRGGSSSRARSHRLTSDAGDKQREDDYCFREFNPSPEARYNETVRNWAMACLEVASQAAAGLRRGAAMEPLAAV